MGKAPPFLLPRELVLPSPASEQLLREDPRARPQLGMEGQEPGLGGKDPRGASPPPEEEPHRAPSLLAEDPAGAAAAKEAPPPALGMEVVEEEDEEGEGEMVEVNHQHTQTKRKATAKQGAAGYTVRAVVPAEKAELVSVAKAMHRERFGRTVQELFNLEREAALKAIKTGLYVGWRCPEYLWDCFRVGDRSKCFCGHLLQEHQVYAKTRVLVPCAMPNCKCQGFAFIPARPEDVGEFWLKRRIGFNATAWRATCRCKHSHEQHMPRASRACQARGCCCTGFESSFLCAACDRRWEEHETFFESTEARRQGGRPYGEAYLPFAEMPELRNAVLTGHESDSSAYEVLRTGLPAPSSSRPLPLAPAGAWSPAEPDAPRPGRGGHQ
ncbi:protein FAM221B isoform X1 [Alligator mississippiensis]|uniref:protein FAM221B isoform X1 n=1 Tax=Alligator mississippiensis TaxID=8496 RepID=UPI0028772DD5|nr:protein FAM221B isoform X1 [Alligator mississippiensis]